MGEAMRKLKDAYEQIASPHRLVFRGGSWRLPEPILRQHITEPFLALCDQDGLAAKFCKQDLLTTP